MPLPSFCSDNEAPHYFVKNLTQCIGYVYDYSNCLIGVIILLSLFFVAGPCDAILCVLFSPNNCFPWYHCLSAVVRGNSRGPWFLSTAGFDSLQYVSCLWISFHCRFSCLVITVILKFYNIAGVYAVLVLGIGFRLLLAFLYEWIVLQGVHTTVQNVPLA